MGAWIQNPGHLYTSPAFAFTETSHWDSFSCTVQVCVTVSFTFCSFHLQKRETYFPFPATDIYLFTLLTVAAKFQQTAIGCCTFFFFFKEEGVMERWQKSASRQRCEYTWRHIRLHMHTLTHSHITPHVCVRTLELTPAAMEVFVRNEEEKKEREKERESAAVADSIRHAGLQCKLLHGHRCGFYGRNTGLF